MHPSGVRRLKQLFLEVSGETNQNDYNTKPEKMITNALLNFHSRINFAFNFISYWLGFLTLYLFFKCQFEQYTLNIQRKVLVLEWTDILLVNKYFYDYISLTY